MNKSIDEKKERTNDNYYNIQYLLKMEYNSDYFLFVVDGCTSQPQTIDMV